MLSWNGQKILLEILATGGLGGGMAGGAVSGSGSVLEEDAYELENVGSWGSRFPLLKADSIESGTKMRKFDEFNGSEFGPGEYPAEGPEASFYYVGEWGKSGVSQSGGGGYILGEDKEEQLIDNSKGEINKCDLGAGRRISKSCGGYGARKLPLKLDDEIDFDGGKELEKMMSYVSNEDAEGVEKMGKKRTTALEEELFGVFKGRDFWIEKLGQGNGNRINLEISNLGKLISFLSQGQDILKKNGKGGEIIDGARMKVIQGKTKTLGELIKKYLNSLPKKEAQEQDKDGMLMQSGANFLSGREGNVGYKCEDEIVKNQEHENGKEDVSIYYGECKGVLKNENVRVARVIKSVFVTGGKLFVPKKDGGKSGEGQIAAFEEIRDVLTWSYWTGIFTGINAKPKLEILSGVITETCTQDGEDVGFGGTIRDSSSKIKSELCKEIIKPGFGDEVSNKRVCYFKFKNGPQNYLRRGNFFNGMLKIPVGYKDAEGYGAKCSVHGI